MKVEVTKIPNLTSNGIVMVSGGDGTVEIDANCSWDKTTKLLTNTQTALAATTTTAHLLTNTTAATNGTQVQVSPAIQQSARGWRTQAGGSSRAVDFFTYVVPATGTAETVGEWRLDYALNSGSKTRGIQYYTNVQDGVAVQKLVVNGFQQITASNSSTIDTLRNLDIINTSGSKSHFTYTFGSTIRAGITVENTGAMEFRSAGSSASYAFFLGSNITSQTQTIQFTSAGIYNIAGCFNQGKVTAGQADTTPPAYLSTYGSFAGRGTLVTSSTYTIDENQFVIYGDASSAFACVGTPAVTTCSTYTASGEATCESHLPCGWNSTACSTFGGVDQTTCESGHTGCTFESLTCSGANNTDQSTCEAQDDAYGGSCVWDTSTCPAFTSTAACNGQAGCTANVSTDCSPLSDGGGDGTNCATQSECSYDNGTGVCSGSYFTSCSGNLCTGSYFTGTCSGTWDVCSGTVLCSAYESSGPCTAETGCSASSGSTWTLPVSTSANEGNVSRFHYLKNIGPSGAISVVAGSGDTLESSISLDAGEGALVHHYKRTSECSEFVSEGTCTPTGCTWVPAVVCSSFGDQSSCESAGCAWDSGCTGAGSAAVCSGTYTSSSKWYKHATI